MSDRIRIEPASVAEPDAPEPERKPPPPPKPPAAPPATPEAERPATPPPAREAAPEPPEGHDEPSEADSEPKEGDTEADTARKAQERTERRIRDATRRRYEAERERDVLRQQMAEIQAQQRAAQPPQPGQPPADAVEEAKRQLRMEQEMRDFNARCNATADRGRAEYGDTAFKEAVDALNAVGAGNRKDFLDTVTEIPDGHRVYPALAADLDRAAEILRMPPPRMILELIKMASEAPQPSAEPQGAAQEPAPVSQAPPPIRPIRSGGTRPQSNSTDTKQSMSDWLRARDRELAGKNSRISR